MSELKMIVNSGGKSLHAWFKWTPGNKKAFLELSQKLGGDPRFKLMNQLCRLPWGTQQKAACQVLTDHLLEGLNDPQVLPQKNHRTTIY